MADDRLRELERTFRRTGAPADEAAWLRARVQAGELTEGRLRLLAHLGHAAAALVSSGPNSLEVDHLDDGEAVWEALAEWFGELEDLDPGARVLAGVVIGRQLLGFCETGAYGGDLERMVERLAAVEAARHGRSSSLLDGDLERITEINVAECEQDSGGDNPPERTAARALTWLGFAFCTSTHKNGGLAEAAYGYALSAHLETARAVVEHLAKDLIPLLLGRPR